METVNAISKERRELEEHIRGFEADRELVRLLFVGLNILGLVIVMLKDLPVWKETGQGEE